MRLSIDARERDFEPALNWIGSLVGAALDRRVASFEAQERKNPLLATHFRGTFTLEFALAKARKYRRNTGRLPNGDEYDLLYGFLIPAQRIHAARPCVTNCLNVEVLAVNTQNLVVTSRHSHNRNMATRNMAALVFPDRVFNQPLRHRVMREFHLPSDDAVDLIGKLSILVGGDAG
jgi:hypothetical protein